jgi:hypothetical protein
MGDLEELEIAGVYVVSVNNGVLRIVIKENSFIELNHVKEIVEWRKSLNAQNPQLTLPDVRKAGSINKEAREYTSGAEVEGLDIAMAILADSLPMRILANFFIKMNQPPAPTKMFTSEKKALNWLEKHR